MPYLPNSNFFIVAYAMHELIGLVLIGLTTQSATLLRTKYELHSFVLSLLISSILRQKEEIVV